jgi:2'-5' RNA ligase
VHASVQRVQEHLSYLSGASAMRWTRPEQFHLTLKFLGSVDAARVPELSAAFSDACAGAGALKLALEGAGCFPSFQKPSVAWLDVSGDVNELKTLQQRIRETVEAFAERIDSRTFSPHLTIGRVKNGAFKTARVFGKALEAEAKKMGRIAEWETRAIHLMRSETLPSGAIYSEVAHAALI